MMHQILESSSNSHNLARILGLKGEFVDYLKLSVMGKNLETTSIKENSGKVSVLLTFSACDLDFDSNKESFIQNGHQIPHYSATSQRPSCNGQGKSKARKKKSPSRRKRDRMRFRLFLERKRARRENLQDNTTDNQLSTSRNSSNTSSHSVSSAEEQPLSNSFSTS